MFTQVYTIFLAWVLIRSSRDFPTSVLPHSSIFNPFNSQVFSTSLLTMHSMYNLENFTVFSSTSPLDLLGNSPFQ